MFISILEKSYVLAYIFNVKHQEQLRWCGAIEMPNYYCRHGQGFCIIYSLVFSYLWVLFYLAHGTGA